MSDKPSSKNHNRAVGIDLGTTLSAVAQVSEYGEPVVVANLEGELRTPSVVFFGKESVLVGRDAVREGLANPERCVSAIKRSMGDANYRFVVDGESYTPESISSFILRKVTQDAAKAIESPKTIWIRRQKPPDVSPKASASPVAMMMITATILATGPWTDSRIA